MTENAIFLGQTTVVFKWLGLAVLNQSCFRRCLRHFTRNNIVVSPRRKLRLLVCRQVGDRWLLYMPSRTRPHGPTIFALEASATRRRTEACAHERTNARTHTRTHACSLVRTYTTHTITVKGYMLKVGALVKVGSSPSESDRALPPAALEASVRPATGRTHESTLTYLLTHGHRRRRRRVILKATLVWKYY